MEFVVHTTETAPPASREDLETAERLFGFVPNLLGVLAAAPIALEAYIILTKLLEDASLIPVEERLRILHGCAQHRSRRSRTAGACPDGAPRRDRAARQEAALIRNKQSRFLSWPAKSCSSIENHADLPPRAVAP
jgi:hypothetical protein